VIISKGGKKDCWAEYLPTKGEAAATTALKEGKGMEKDPSVRVLGGEKNRACPLYLLSSRSLRVKKGKDPVASLAFMPPTEGGEKEEERSTFSPVLGSPKRGCPEFPLAATNKMKEGKRKKKEGRGKERTEDMQKHLHSFAHPGKKMEKRRNGGEICDRRNALTLL